jgi:HAD superfamily hydrolase (TIGR01484 family)
MRMRFLVLCTDYDGTIAHDGRVDDATIAALEDLRASGRKLVLVTGREIDDLQRVFERLDLFDRVVAENGALIYRPQTREERLLAEAPPRRFIEELRSRGVSDLSVGRCIVATWTPHENRVLETIRDLGLEMQVIFNKGAVMVLPSGLNKAAGLQAALEELNVSIHNAVGVGDAENDHAFLNICECSAAVSNALPAVKDTADIVLARDHGAGVTDLVREILGDDLASHDAKLRRHEIRLGKLEGGEDVTLSPFAINAMVVGTSGGGKSTIATGLVERLHEKGYSFCIIDPEGDYDALEGAAVLGGPERAPSVDECMQILSKPRAERHHQHARHQVRRSAEFLHVPVRPHPRPAREDRASALAGGRRSASRAARGLAPGRTGHAAAARRHPVRHLDARGGGAGGAEAHRFADRARRQAPRDVARVRRSERGAVTGSGDGPGAEAARLAVAQEI